MKSFDKGWIERQPISQNILRSVRLLGEFKGREALYRQQMPQMLETLRHVAVIQSAESSNRIEGVTAPPKRILSLMAKKTKPKDRPEQEIAGYRDVLNTIHAQHAHIPITTGVVPQFHRDLYKYAGGPAGKWKVVENEIAELRPDGPRRVLFSPVSAMQTPEFMEQLHSDLNDSGTAAASMNCFSFRPMWRISFAFIRSSMEMEEWPGFLPCSCSIRPDTRLGDSSVLKRPLRKARSRITKRSASPRKAGMRLNTAFNLGRSISWGP